MTVTLLTEPSNIAYTLIIILLTEPSNITYTISWLYDGLIPLIYNPMTTGNCPTTLGISIILV